MNLNQLGGPFGRRIIRSLMRAAMAVGIAKGINTVANRGKDPASMTPAERAQAKKTQKNSRDMVKRARQAARITRRIR
ncbi:hypothetical protein [Paracoccus jeotgali]|nr:hypothetical protein [Paracoccus jeotgali]